MWSSLSLFFLKEHVLPTIKDKSPWDHSNAIFMYFFNSGFPYETVHPLRNVLAVLLPPSLYKVKSLKNSGYMCPTLFWGERRGWACVN